MPATIGVTFSPYSKLQYAAILVDNEQTQSEMITGTPGVNAVGTLVCSDTLQVCRVSVTGAAIWVTFGPAPIADPGEKFLILDGQTEFFAINVGDKIAVFEVAA